MGAQLQTLRARVRDRISASGSDPMFADSIVDRQINMAVRKIERAQPDGWWFQHQEFTSSFASPTPVEIYQIAAFQGLIRKIYSVFLSLDGSYWMPIEERATRTDQVRMSGGSAPLSPDGYPLSWHLVPLMNDDLAQWGIAFSPSAPGSAHIKYIAVTDQIDMVNDVDPLTALPNLIGDLVVEFAANALIRQKRSVGTITVRRRFATLATVTDQAAEEWLKAARLYLDAGYSGPGYPSQIREMTQ